MRAAVPPFYRRARARNNLSKAVVIKNRPYMPAEEANAKNPMIQLYNAEGDEIYGDPPQKTRHAMRLTRNNTEASPVSELFGATASGITDDETTTFLEKKYRTIVASHSPIMVPGAAAGGGAAGGAGGLVPYLNKEGNPVSMPQMLLRGRAGDSLFFYHSDVQQIVNFLQSYIKSLQRFYSKVLADSGATPQHFHYYEEHRMPLSEIFVDDLAQVEEKFREFESLIGPDTMNNFPLLANKYVFFQEKDIANPLVYRNPYKLAMIFNELFSDYNSYIEKKRANSASSTAFLRELEEARVRSRTPVAGLTPAPGFTPRNLSGLGAEAAGGGGGAALTPAASGEGSPALAVFPNIAAPADGLRIAVPRARGPGARGRAPTPAARAAGGDGVNRANAAPPPMAPVPPPAPPAALARTSSATRRGGRRLNKRRRAATKTKRSKVSRR
jgi:hypothetical protein